jgi:N-methylhydantoinase A
LTWRIAVDIGGTFTDLVAFDDAGRSLVRSKVLTTPARLVDGVLRALDKARLPIHDASGFVHGSTVAINAILQKEGANTALLTTRGFRDVLEMGRKSRPDMYNLFFRPRTCLVPREQRLEVSERVSFSGEVLEPVDMEHLAELVRCLPPDIESVAICFLHSYSYPHHEQLAAAAVESARPDTYVAVSSAISGEFREYERTSTTVANAYVGPLVAGYIAELRSDLHARGSTAPLLITQSNGGVMTADMAIRQPIRTTESGPAAGANGAAWLGRELAIDDLIAFDMGGTSAKACVIKDGRPEVASEYYIGGWLTGIPVQVPFLDIVEVGAGGGSIAYLDAGRGLRVGPRSAGAMPGPACYGLGGTEPTVTDANVVVGKIGHESLLGGEMQLEPGLAEHAVARLAADLGVDLHRCANGIIRVANSIMANAIRAVTVERGRDPRDFTLVAYGGAGPLHAVAVAAELQIPRVLVPAGSGTFGAFGMLVTDLRHDVARTYVGHLDTIEVATLEGIFASLEREAAEFMTQHGTAKQAVNIQNQRRLDLRYVGQFHPLTLDLPAGPFAEVLREVPHLFHAAHDVRYGHSAPAEKIEVSAVRLIAISQVQKPAAGALAHLDRPGGGPGTSRNALFEDGTWAACDIYAMRDLEVGRTVAGPAVVEDDATSIVLSPGTKGKLLAGGHLLIELGGRSVA